MSQATAQAHANLAFVKYWGKRDPSLNLPSNSSLSMNLDAATTTTTVGWGTAQADTVLLNGAPAPAGFAARVRRHLDRLRALADDRRPAHVTTANNFPAGTGFASSASGLAALTVAGAAALGLTLDEAALSRLARQGSGSACRSVPGGFVEWVAGASDMDSVAHSIAPAEHWDLRDVAVVVAREAKAVSSTDGHALAAASPFWEARQAALPHTLSTVRRAILDRDFATFGQATEAEALNMHAVMLTSAHSAGDVWHSGLLYLAPGTVTILAALARWRANGLPVYLTLDAGPTAHLLCEARHADDVQAAVRALPGADGWDLIVSGPGAGARLLQ